MSAWIDISLPLKNGLAPWPGDRPFQRASVSEIGVGGAEYCLSALSMSSHTGTHMDAPKHFVAGGAPLDAIDPGLFIGPAYVIDLSGLTAHVTAKDLAALPEGVARLLIKTRNSQRAGDGEFHTDFIALSLEAVTFLAHRGIRLLGIDAYSIAPYETQPEIHRAFLGTPGAAVVENVNLTKAQEGWYDLACLPLPVEGGDGAPARALIRRMEASS